MDLAKSVCLKVPYHTGSSTETESPRLQFNWLLLVVRSILFFVLGQTTDKNSKRICLKFCLLLCKRVTQDLK